MGATQLAQCPEDNLCVDVPGFEKSKAFCTSAFSFKLEMQPREVNLMEERIIALPDDASVQVILTGHRTRDQYSSAHQITLMPMNNASGICGRPVTCLSCNALSYFDPPARTRAMAIHIVKQSAADNLDVYGVVW